MEITFEEYIAARKIVDTYEEQQRVKKLSPYAGCTRTDFQKKIWTNPMTGREEHLYWVTKEDVIPERVPDGTIEWDHACGFFTLERSQTPYYSLEDAEKNLFRTFKRKGLIS